MRTPDDMAIGCERCREQLLDSLYGLLDPAEDVALAAHLAACPACTAAKADAAGMQGLFATAAKAPFPDVTFEIPIESVPAAPARSPRRSFRWAIAAGLLIASLGLLAPAIRDYANYRDRASAVARVGNQLRDLERTDAERLAANARLLADLDRQLADVRESHKRQLKTWVNAEVAANAKPFRLEVTGPVAAIPGAINEYIIATRAGANAVPTTVTATVRDARGTEYDKQTLKPGETKLRLPASLWAKFPAGADDLVLAIRATDSTGATAELAEPIQLLAPVLATLVVTDKPLYRPGERVFFRSLTLNRTNLQPPARDLALRFELRKPDGTPLTGATLTGTALPVLNRDGVEAPVAGPDGNPVRGVACGVLGLPESLPGGEYTLAAFEIPVGWAGAELPNGSTPIATRTITVAKYKPDVLTKTLDFDASTYGPGDTVKAKLTVKNQGKPLANMLILVSAVHGTNTAIKLKPPGQLNADGTAEITFVLPNLPDLKNATLSVTILDQNAETIVRPVPLASKRISLEFFPEGGDLIEGLPNRVYVRATTATGRPADVTGFLTDGTRTVCEVATLTDAEHPGANQGLGVFGFTPEPGKRYALKLTRPAGTVEPSLTIPELKNLGTGFPLPKAEADGVVLAIPGGVFTANQPLTGTLTSTTKRALIVGVYTRGVVVGHQRIVAEPGKPMAIAVAPPAAAVGGVTRVTGLEEPVADTGRADLLPLAERLVFRRPTEKLNLEFASDKSSYSPGDPVSLQVTATDEKNRPAAAVLMAAVVNQSVLAMADDRVERHLPTHFLLAGELQKPEQLENADFVLTAHPKAAATLDLLLGTQGWRRFAEAQGEFRSTAPSDAEKRRFWIANGRQDSMTESARPDRATAHRLNAMGTLDAKIDQLESAKRSIEIDRERKSPEWRTLRVAELMEREEAHKSWRNAKFNVLSAATGIVLLVLVVASVAFVGRKDVRSMVALLATAVVALSAILYFLYPMFRIGSDELTTQEDLIGLASPTVEREPTIDLRDKVTTGPPVPPAVGEPPPRADLGPGPPSRPVPAATAKLRTDRADRAVRAMSDAAPAGDEMAAIDRIKKSLVRHAPFVVREYAHLPAKTTDDTRLDFTETVFWHPVLVLPGEGRIELNFRVSDAANAYRVLLAGHTLDGRLGSVAGLLPVRKPLEVDAKLPPELGTGDRPIVPLVVANATGAALDAKLGYWSDYLVAEAEPQSVAVPPAAGARRTVSVRPVAPGLARVRTTASGGRFADALERTVSIVPDGFPVGDVAKVDLSGSANATLTIPDNLVPQSLAVKVRVFTNSLADIQSGLDGLLREPHGCFEQTSSANYPNILALEYLKDANRLGDPLADRARGLLERGLARLASFEVAQPAGGRAGFEWFGASPAHECLTAYGLVQFVDLARSHPVDQQLIDRTRKFLLARRDGQGGFSRKRDAHAFGSVPDAVANAYLAWALHAADPAADLTLETKAIAAEALSSKDPYRLALAAHLAPTPAVLAALAARQKSDGSFPGAETSITRSRGRDLIVETTALAALAFTRAKSRDRAANLADAIAFLVKAREPHGAFGGTQATVLALKAIVAFNAAHRRPRESGTIVVKLAGRELARVPFDSESVRPVEIDLPADERGFPPGRHAITIETDATQTYPASLTWSAYCRKPATAGEAPLSLDVTLAAPTATEGETVRLTVKLTNREAGDPGMAVAVIGLPAGLRLPADFAQLKGLTARPATGEPVVSHWELNGRELVLYWRGLAPRQTVDVSLDLIATWPGDYRGPASRAYLYYGADAKHWLDPLAIQIRPRN